jgi:hypothetical protein
VVVLRMGRISFQVIQAVDERRASVGELAGKLGMSQRAPLKRLIRLKICGVLAVVADLPLSCHDFHAGEACQDIHVPGDFLLPPSMSLQSISVTST